MGRWLAIAAVLAVQGGGVAQAQVKGLSPDEIVAVSRSRALDFRLSQELGQTRPVPLVRGMVLSHDLAPNAVVGIGLSNLYTKRSRAEFRPGERPVRGRKPAVTFVFRF